MKNFICFFTRPVVSFFSVLLIFGGSSCSNEPQRLLFSNHPTEYKKTDKEVVEPTPQISAPLTASAAAEPAVILSPEAYTREKAMAEINRNKAVEAALVNSSATAHKATLREKITTLKVVRKEIKSAKKEIKKLKEGKKVAKVAEGPVTNDVAIKVIILGLIVALLGLIVPVLGGLGGLIVVVGLVLLLLNYV